MGRRLHLGHSDAIGGVDDLALQVRWVDHVVVDEADGADARRRQVEPDRRARAAGAERSTFELSSLICLASPISGSMVWRA